MKPKVFLDTDILISALMSQKGAAHRILFQSDLNLYGSNYSRIEFERVAIEHKLDLKLTSKVIKKLIICKLTKTKIKSSLKYVFDLYDAHIIAGARMHGVNFLITYNLKDYDLLLIKKELGITVVTPGHLLQTIS